MLKSMTGFGRAEGTVGDKEFLVEIKSLNGKQFDVQLRIPNILKPFEFEIRNLLSEYLKRGSIECNISLKQNGAARPVTLNSELAIQYYESIKKISDTLNLDSSQILGALLKLPEIFTPSTNIMSDEDWIIFKDLFTEALNRIDKHRLDEGEALEKDILERIANILGNQEKIVTLEPERMIRFREELKKTLAHEVGMDNIDQNRMEQELIYYIEKMDISEEQVRLKNHCDYFLEVLHDADHSKGKKLSFILQEIGREINTTGSKAYDSNIQKCVVLMKDELEKAKEQILNVL